MKTKRTTVYLSDEIRRMIKGYQVSHDKTMKEIIEMGVRRVITEPVGKEKPIPAARPNKYLQRILQELGKYIDATTAKSIVTEICRSHNLELDDINPRAFSPEIISQISRIVSRFSQNCDPSKIETRLFKVLKNRK